MLDNVTNTMENCLYPFLESVIGSDTILVGHSLENDLRAMKLIYTKVIDSAVLFMRKNGTKYKLKSLSEKILKVLFSLLIEKDPGGRALLLRRLPGYSSFDPSQNLEWRIDKKERFYRFERNIISQEVSSDHRLCNWLCKDSILYRKWNPFKEITTKRHKSWKKVEIYSK